jgi:hypothetical protein
VEGSILLSGNLFLLIIIIIIIVTNGYCHQIDWEIPCGFLWNIPVIPKLNKNELGIN